MVIIKTADLTRLYRQGDTVIHAVYHVSLTIEEGDFVAITGSSGSGKTTLLNLMGGVDTPTDGKVFVRGFDIYAQNPEKLAMFRRQQIGYIFQNYNLIPILTAEENIVLPALLDHRKVDVPYFRELAETLGISDRILHLPGELSGGQQQRVAVARALINRPSVILADEPTGNLDKESADELMNLLVKINSLGNTIIMVTHDAAVAKHAHRVYHMDNGSIV